MFVLLIKQIKNKYKRTEKTVRSVYIATVYVILAIG